MLAARVAGIPAIPVGMGWNLPPPTSPMPAIRFWHPPAPVTLRTSEARVLAAIAPALAAVGGACLPSLADLFDPAQSCLCSFPELDHYPARQDGDYFGAIYQATEGVTPVWPAGTGTRCFAYVNGRHPALHALLGGIADSGAPTVLHLRGVPCDGQATVPPNAWLASTPVRMDAILSAGPIVVCQGMHTMAAALAAGCPVLSMPEHLEQTVLANRLAQQGLGLAVAPDAQRQDVAAALQRLADDSLFRTRAAAFAARYAGYDPAMAVRAVVGECLDRLA